jgi:hypothetical protein
MDEQENQEVAVDAGALHEACQAANAWAGYLRDVKADNYAKANDTEKATQMAAAADRIDQAVAQLQRESLAVS